ncbi:hypothetical protein Tco_0300982 [Tanacetum coccineum]
MDNYNIKSYILNILLTCEMDSLQLIDLSKEDDCLLPLSFRDVCEMESLQLIDLSNEDDCLLPLSLRDVCEMDSLQLIDLSKEDDCLLPLSLRDVCEMDSLQLIDLLCEMDSVPSVEAGKKAECSNGKGWRYEKGGIVAIVEGEAHGALGLRGGLLDCLLPLSLRDVCEMDSLQLIDLSKEDDCLLPLSLRDSVEDVKLSCAVGFDNASMIKRGKMRPVEERSLSELRKSLDWNSAFFTSQGLLNPEELSMINKAFQKTSCSCQPSFSSRKDLKPDIHKRSTVPINRHGLAPNQVVMEHRTRKAGAGSTLSSRSQGDFSSRLTSFTTLKTKMSKVHRSNESPSGASSKCISRNIKSRNIKPTIVDRSSSVLSPLSSTCSSSTSPSRSFHNATSPSDFQTPRCDAARPPIRKIKCLGLRMPYPNTGPFDEAQAVSKGSMHKLNQIEASTLCISAENCLKVKKLLSREHDGRKVGARCSKPKSNGQIHNEMLKDRMNHERKSLKNDSSSFKGKVVINIEKTQEHSDQCSLKESQKEDMCSYEDKVNGLSSHLESIGLDRYSEVKSQGSCAKRGQPFLETNIPSFLRRSLDWDSAFITGADSDGLSSETFREWISPNMVNPDNHIKNMAKMRAKRHIALQDHTPRIVHMGIRLKDVVGTFGLRIRTRGDTMSGVENGTITVVEVIIGDGSGRKWAGIGRLEWAGIGRLEWLEWAGECGTGGGSGRIGSP